MGRMIIRELLERFDRRDWKVLGKAISIVENQEEGCWELLNHAWKTAQEECLVVGITGAGGAGKSTLIDKLIRICRDRDRTVGVLAVDPSSPYTGGAMLGDRVRMNAHSSDPGVYIRSFASRGSFGGISQGAKYALYLYKAFGFDVIFLESLGVGQAETDISCFVDVTTVILAPGNGDAIQLAKAGTQEIADIFVINKGDKPEAEMLRLQLMAEFAVVPEEYRPLIVKTTAKDGTGVEELTDCFSQVSRRLLPARRIKQQIRIENEIFTGAACFYEPQLRRYAKELTQEVLAGTATPFEAAIRLGNKILIKDQGGIYMQMREAIQSRKSIRGYLPEPVSKEVLEQVLELATRAVSAINMQPWEFAVVTGAPLDAIRQCNTEDLRNQVSVDIPEPKANGIYRDRRIEIAKQLFKAMDIKREDKERRNWWLERGFRFFEAPVLILVMADEEIDPLVSRLDIGCFTQNLCLAAMEYGLGTCVQTQAVMYQRGIREVLKLPESKRPVVGIALGYPEPEFPANKVVSCREKVENITSWTGFY